MRKDNLGRNGIGGVYKTVTVTGLNLDRLLNVLNKKGIELFFIKKTGARTVILRVKERDFAKFFAITRDLCYNIKVKGTGGKFYLPFYLIKNFGIIIGMAVFIISAVLFNDIIIDYSFSGTGSIYKEEVAAFLTEKGVNKYSRFSAVNLKTLGDEILSSFDNLSFATCEKRGNRLYCELVLSTDKKDLITGDVPLLISEYDGVIADIKVYSGTAKVSVGDTVRAGDLIVEGYQTLKDQKIDVSVIARVVILSEYVEEYSATKGETTGEYVAELIREKWGKETESVSFTEKEDGERIIYTVTLKYKNVIFAG